MSKKGAPSSYTVELADRICLLCQKHSLMSVLERNPDLPDRSAIYEWFDKYPYFADKYARACEIRADFKADEIDHLADRTIGGEVDANAARVAIDAKKWCASKLRPKRYGESMRMTGDPESPLAVNISMIDSKL